MQLEYSVTFTMDLKCSVVDNGKPPTLVTSMIDYNMPITMAYMKHMKLQLLNSQQDEVNHKHLWLHPHSGNEAPDPWLWSWAWYHLKAVIYIVNEKKCHQDLTDMQRAQRLHSLDTESLDESIFLSAMWERFLFLTKLPLGSLGKELGSPWASVPESSQGQRTSVTVFS